MKGLSSRNLKYIRHFAQECPDCHFGQQPAAQLPWFHIVTLITQVPDPTVRAWYAERTIVEAWSRDTLSGQIRSQLHLRQGNALTNFAERLPAGQAGLAAGGVTWGGIAPRGLNPSREMLDGRQSPFGAAICSHVCTGR